MALGVRSTPRAVLFDFGNVLVPWDPRSLYRKIFADPAAMEDFLARVCTPDWNLAMDGGAPFGPAIEERVRAFPEYEPAIRAWLPRFGEMNEGAIPGMTELVAELEATPLRLGILSNMSAETRDVCLANFPRLHAFHAIVVSGEEKAMKPDPAIYALSAERLGTAPGDILFVDDSAKNVAGAEVCGMRGHVFTGAAALRDWLCEQGAL